MERRPSRNRDEKRPFTGHGDADKKSGGFRRGPARAQRVSIPKDTEISYKNFTFLQKCLTERGKILSRRLLSGDATMQREISMAVKRARYLGLLPSGSSKRK